MNQDDKYDRSIEESAGESSFLRRWSERKVQAREQEGQPKIIEPVSESSIKELTDADMPALDSLNENSDYKGFFSPKVSETLRRQALRKLFQLPQFNVMDGLDVYQEDFTQFTSLGDIVTQEMRHRLEVEAKRITQSLSEAAELNESPADGTVIEAAQTTSEQTQRT